MLPDIIIRPSLALWAGVGILSLVAGQIEYDPTSNSLVCSKLNGSYCLSESLAGSIMISCVSSTVAEVRSCNIEIAPLLPSEYDTSAVCYEPTPDSGRALCAFNGTGYSLNGSRIPIPETRLCDFVNPSVAQEGGSEANSKGVVKKALDAISDGASGLVSRLLAVGSGSSRSAETVTPDQETVYCSNPRPGRAILGQGTGASTGTGSGTGTGIRTKARVIAPSDPTLTAIPNPGAMQTHSLRPLGHMIEVTTDFGRTSSGCTTEAVISTSSSNTTGTTEKGGGSTETSVSLTTVPCTSTSTSTSTNAVSSTSSSLVQTTFSLGAAPAPASSVNISWVLVVGVSCLLALG